MVGSVMKRPDQISLDAVSQEPLAFSCDLDFRVGALDREPLLEISPVRMAGEVSRVEGGYALRAQIAYEGKLECSRCLADYPFAERQEFSLLLYPGKPPQGADVLLSRDDLDIHFYQDPLLALSPLTEERIQMAIPMKPLCRQDCRGLCARCGSDLNAGPCGCAMTEVDPRWAALRSLKKV
jgi:uncharacterized protein